MPSQWTRTTYALGDSKVYDTVKLKVERVEHEVPVSDKDFSIVVQPGEIMWEYEYPKEGRGLDTYSPAIKKSIVNNHGSSELISKVGFQTPDGEVMPIEHTSMYILIIPIVVIVLIAIAFFVSRNRLSKNAF